MIHSADILIVTVNSNEAKAVLDAFLAATGVAASLFTQGDHTYHKLGTLNGQQLVMVQSEMGSVGPGASLQTVSQAIAALKPAAVIMVGVAFGMDEAKQDIGRILVSKQLLFYEIQKVATGPDGGMKLIPRGARVDSSPKLLSHLQAVGIRREHGEAQVEYGLLLSGEKLIDNAAFVEMLQSIAPEAVGGEMEGNGLYTACHNGKVDWILVKAICDWANGTKSKDKDANQKLAAKNAAEFVAQALKASRILPSQPNGSREVTIKLGGRLAEFSLTMQEGVLLIIAGITKIKQAVIQVIGVEEGSVFLRILLPETAAKELVQQWQAASQHDIPIKEIAHLTKFGVQNIDFSQLLVRSQVTLPTPEELWDRFSEAAAESGIVTVLAASPLYRERPAQAFNVATLLDADEMSAFIQSTQPKEWAKLAKQFPGVEHETLAAQVSALTAKRGTLEVLRNGISFNGINLQLAFFKPSAGGNPEHQARYAGNRFAIMRQVHFSTKTPDQSVDMVILLNGLPIVSLELKNHFTGQNVQHAIAQYRRRDPREPFFARCLVHFALDDDAAYMATQLFGKETQFLPFNRDTKNPLIYNRFASSYLWADFSDADGRTELGVLKADSLLELIQNYLHFERDLKTGKEKFIFPRFHQLMVVRKLLAHAKANGSGHNYLIQHSAGSGKSNSIAWLAHQLANLCGADDQPVFDSIVVITDRRVLDRQLQDTIKQFEKIKGTVTKIDRNTKQLVKALERGDKIIITTLQKFGFVGELARLPGKKFAVIVDEAHSSQTGENVKDLKIVLTSEEQLKAALEKDDEGQEEDPLESELEKIQKARQKLPHLSFFAFTATPKDKTLELFGIPDKKVKKGFRPFHEYTMRQAIAEGFILDVLQSYTTYKTYFELIQNEKAEGDKLVEELKARRLLLEYVDQHAFAIKRKAHIIVDHFTRQTAYKIAGQAKAMVVTHSRAHAVLYQQAIAEVLREQKLPFGLLVAFSGTVTINEQKYTEENMNPPGTGDIAEAFKNPAQRLLVVANKFQTGFDQPLLHTMYVDKKLGGVAAVQTLSRLNRVFPPLKLDTLVLDFVNEQETIQASFQDYYQRTDLEGATDPNKLYNLKYTLEQMHVFTPDDVAQFAQLFIFQKVTSEQLAPFFQRIVDTGYANLGSEHVGKPDHAKLAAEAKDKFRKETARYVRQYTFISQIMTFTDPALELFYLFAKLLLKKLPFERISLPREVMDMVDMDKFRVQEEQNGRIVLAAVDATLEPTADDGHRGKAEEDKERLKIVVQKLNAEYGIAFEDADRVITALKDVLEKDDDLKAAMRSNSIEDLKKRKLKDSIQDALMSNADDNLTFLSKLETDPGFGKFFFSEMFRWYSAAVTKPNP